MEIRTHSVIKYLPTLERREPAVMDSTALTTFMSCPRKYWYRIVAGYVPKLIMPYFNFGSSYHKFREVLETLTIKGENPIPAYNAGKEAAVEVFKKGGGNPTSGTKWDFMTEARLLESCEYVFTKVWLQEKAAKKVKVLMCEQPFLLEMEDGTTIAGRADQIVQWNGKVWGRDFKTTSKLGPFYDRSMEPNDQFTRYTWAESKLTGEKVQGQMIEVLFNAKRPANSRKSASSFGPQIENFLATRTGAQLKVWEVEHAFWMRMMQMCRDEDIWPMNTKSCNFCEYHQVCRAPTENGQLNTLKNYYSVSYWDCQKTDQVRDD